MKKIILAIFTITFLSCTLEFDTGTRILVKGTIVDQNNNPIPDIEVNVFAEKIGPGAIPIGCPTCDRRRIMTGKSKENGEFILFSSLAENATNYEVFFNTKDGYNFINPAYDDIQIENIPPDTFSNYMLDLGKQILK